jgi:hypothetical protein
MVVEVEGMPVGRRIEAGSALGDRLEALGFGRTVASAISTIGLSVSPVSSSASHTGGRLRLMLPTGVAGNIRETTCTVTPGITFGHSSFGLATPKASSVLGPATPSGTRPSLFWKEIRAAFVPPPKSPSTFPVSKPRFLRACCSFLTADPAEPLRRVAMVRLLLQSSGVFEFSRRFSGLALRLSGVRAERRGFLLPWAACQERPGRAPGSDSARRRLPSGLRILGGAEGDEGRHGSRDSRTFGGVPGPRAEVRAVLARR